MKIMENGIPHRNYSLVRLSYGSGYDFEQPMFNCYEILNKWQKEREPGKGQESLGIKAHLSLHCDSKPRVCA
jgi:hypothetical protein